MTNATVSPDSWDDTTPADRRIPWRKVTAPDTRSGPLSTHPTMTSRGMVHTAPWWAEGTLYTDNARWLDLIRRQARRNDAQFTEQAAPDGPPADYRAQVETMRHHAEAHGLRPAITHTRNAYGTTPPAHPY
jgi:hypothetical protein